MLMSHLIANFTLHKRQLTLFAPTNKAFQKHHGDTHDDLVLYHMGKNLFKKPSTNF